MRKSLVGIWGLGESGVGAALLAKKHGYDMLLVASQPPAPHHARILEGAQLSWEVVEDPFPLLNQCEVIIRSPGIRPDTEALRKLLIEGKKIISDLEWGGWHFPSHAILWLVTGSTGKTSTTALLAHLLRTGGKQAIACGNIGYSFGAALTEEKIYEYYVLEASSFQLWDTYTLTPHLAVITNLTRNHIDWHGSYEAYVDAKLRFVTRLRPENHLLYDAGSLKLVEALSRYPIRCKVWRYREVGGDGITAWIENQNLIC
ncbi:MAG: Mur ligase family protein, partial [Bacteroidia bacterium]|nr:Mur ligase family protein [Bacteroidia bacterium]MDW8134351.1 Mur ligase family protein [Bacteroidia bacterium]